MSRIERDTPHATITVDAIDDIADVEVRLSFKPLAMLIPRRGIGGEPSGPYARATNEQIATIVARAVSDAITSINQAMRRVEVCTRCGCVQSDQAEWYENARRPGELLCSTCYTGGAQ